MINILHSFPIGVERLIYFIIFLFNMVIFYKSTQEAPNKFPTSNLTNRLQDLSVANLTFLLEKCLNSEFSFLVIFSWTELILLGDFK